MTTAPAPSAAAPAPTALTLADVSVTHRTRHGSTEALRGVDLHVDAGEILAVLGPNAAGKTSLLEACEGFRPVDGGVLRVLGRDPADRRQARELRQLTGVMLQTVAVEPRLTVLEVLRRNARYYRRPLSPAAALDLVGLQGVESTLVRRLSGGQQRRLDLALAVLGRPRVLFLDEPTNGFDPPARRATWALLRGLAAAGTTVVLTTHYLDEATQLADRVAVLVAGRVAALGPPDRLGIAAEDGAARITFALPREGRPPVLAGDTLTEEGAHGVLATDNATRALHSLTGWALQRGLRLEDLQVRRPSLEEVYLDLLDGGTRAPTTGGSP